jgi:tRNA(Ile)-lysidine synthase
MGFEPGKLVPFPELNGEFDIAVPGRTEIPGWTIETAFKTVQDFSDNPDSLNAWLNDGFTAWFDKDSIGDKIKVRSRRPGDWFRPFGMEHPKKVGEFMLDARIPRDWRDRIPVMCNLQQIIWVAGWRIDDRVKVTPSTQEVLCIKLGRVADEQYRKGGENR